MVLLILVLHTIVSTAEFIGIVGRMVSPVTADPAAARQRNPPRRPKTLPLDTCDTLITAINLEVAVDPSY